MKYLFFWVAELGKVIYCIENCTFICDTCIKEMLPPALIHTDALKYQPFWKSWLDRPYLKYRVYVKGSRPHWCKVLFHSTPYNLTSDRNKIINVSSELWVSSIESVFLFIYIYLLSFLLLLFVNKSLSTLSSSNSCCFYFLVNSLKLAFLRELLYLECYINHLLQFTLDP